MLSEGTEVRLVGDSNGTSRMILVAGRPLREPVARYGPFVMNTREQLIQAVEDFQKGRFWSLSTCRLLRPPRIGYFCDRLAYIVRLCARNDRRICSMGALATAPMSRQAPSSARRPRFPGSAPRTSPTRCVQLRARLACRRP